MQGTEEASRQHASDPRLQCDPAEDQRSLGISRISFVWAVLTFSRSRISPTRRDVAFLPDPVPIRPLHLNTSKRITAVFL